VPRSFRPAVLLTTLIIATGLAVVKSRGRIRGGRAPGVQRPMSFAVVSSCIDTPDQPHSRRAS
jgi:hypothetical protein